MNIIKRIEDLRYELVRLGALKGFQDPEVIKLSQRIDDLINRYYHITLERLNAKRAG
ncbi:MAG: aspartyl-phosphate phosphatase Spo0E family protein [Syntrophomonas sp.]